MPTLLDKISSYNLFNNLLPGTLFAAFVSRYTSFALIHEDILLALFIYYFVGVVISRLGSLVVEPVLLKVGFVTFTEYTDYVKVSKSDARLDLLLESSNSYRTLCTAAALVLVAIASDKLMLRFPSARTWFAVALGVGIVVLFASAFRKQSEYIGKRVKAGL
jgi:hypothetical protein